MMVWRLCLLGQVLLDVCIEGEDGTYNIETYSSYAFHLVLGYRGGKLPSGEIFGILGWSSDSSGSCETVKGCQ